MKFHKTIDLSYDDVSSMADNLAAWVGVHQPDMIVGLSRGGLVPAVQISHMLEVPMRPVVWQTRDDIGREVDPFVLQAIRDGQVVVFVDDINDSGLTFSEIKSYYIDAEGLSDKNVFFTTLVEKTSSTFDCDMSALKIDDPRWIIFPWEE